MSLPERSTWVTTFCVFRFLSRWLAAPTIISYACFSTGFFLLLLVVVDLKIRKQWLYVTMDLTLFYVHLGEQRERSSCDVEFPIILEQIVERSYFRISNCGIECEIRAFLLGAEVRFDHGVSGSHELAGYPNHRSPFIKMIGQIRCAHHQVCEKQGVGWLAGFISVCNMALVDLGSVYFQNQPTLVVHLLRS